MRRNIIISNEEVTDSKIENNTEIVYKSICDPYTYNEWMKECDNTKAIMFYDEVKNIIGNSFSKDDYSKYYYNSCQYEYNDILSDDRINTFDLSNNGVYCDCGRGVLTKDAIVQLIGLLIEQYNNYDIYHKRFLDSCRESHIKKAYAIKKELEEEKIKIERNKQGYIYVMYHQGYYKIGKTKDCKRLGEYTRLAEEPEYITVEYVDKMDMIEKEIHRQYDERRNRNGSCEWFSLSKSDIEDIKRFLKIHSVENHEHTKYYKRYVLKEGDAE